MSNQQIVLMIVVVSTLFVVVIVAANMGQSSGDSGSTGLDSSKRFTAKSGTSREKATILTSSERPASGVKIRTASEAAKQAEALAQEAADEQAAVEREERMQVRSLSERAEAEMDSPVDREVISALNAFTPDQGIEKLNRLLAAQHTDEEAARIYTALALLYCQVDPPEEERAASALESALLVSPDEQTRLQVRSEQARMLLRQGALEDARALIETALDEVGDSAAPSAARVQLGVALAQIHEQQDRPAEAEAVYQTIMSAAEAATGETDPAAAEAMRLAALRLSRLYRNTGRETEAHELAKAFSETVSVP